MFQNLVSSRNYTVSVAMRNSIGEGPAATVFVSTPEEPRIKDIKQPILILGELHTVIQQHADMLDEPSVLFKTEKLIKGLAIHVSRQLLFVSDSQGNIYQTSLMSHANSTVLLTPQQLKFQPLDLSIDWLNEQLYILGEVTHSSRSKVWQITRFGLDGGGLTVAVAGLLTKPHHIEVDPYNGYLFWVMDGSAKPGIYRLDLANISNGIKHDVIPDIILEAPNLGAFTVDHTNFHLLVPNHNKNTVYSVSFDGREVIDLRENTQQAMFHNVLSLASANGLFYWTNGEEVLTEEYHPGHDSYYHNTFPDLTHRSYFQIAVNLPSCQPIPIPVNPPTGVQAVLGPTLAKTSWQMPHLLGDQGKGAWQNWSYEIQIKDVSTSKIISHKNINTTSFTINGLKENTEYIFKTAAYTSSGSGPWSSEFKGKTLKKAFDDHYPAILWSAAEGLLKSDVTGENIETIIHKTNMKDYFITNIAWYQDMLFFVSNTSHLYWYNTTSHDRGKLLDNDSVGSIAVDWIGKKLYWSNPKQQLIIRGNFNGTQQEPLPIDTVAKELYVDAIHAYIYWSTGHAVECARLNGADRRIYHPAEYFSGKQVMGLTLDNDKQMVYWIVRSHEGSILYKEKMAQHLTAVDNSTSLNVSNLQRSEMKGPLCYFDEHLLWLRDDKNVVIGDMTGQNTAVINGISLSGLSMVSILDLSLHTWKKNGSKSIIVIPEPIFQESVQVEGSWNSFNITWDPVINVNYGKLFYEVKIYDVSKKDITRITTEPSIKYWKPVLPYTRLEITIRAYTYWGSASQTKVQLYSPASTPSIPQNTRCYVIYNHHPFLKTRISILFRWDRPQNSNGVINGYLVKVWSTGENNFAQETIIKPEFMQYVLQNLTQNRIYNFQVQAFTSIGHGINSFTVRCNTSEEKPLPKLLISSTNSIYVQDFDTHKNYFKIRDIKKPASLAYMMGENKLFWLNEAQELFVVNMKTNNKTKLLVLKDNARSLTVDWVERSLYYVQNNSIKNGSSIFKLDLNILEEGKRKIEQILSSDNNISSIKVSPFTRQIYFLEKDQNDKNILMQAHMNGENKKYFFETNIRPFTHISTQENKSCDCFGYEDIEDIFTIDHSDRNNTPKIIFVDSATNDIIAADKDGCNCSSVLNGQYWNESFPISTFTVDVKRIYWSNSTDGFIYSLDKVDKTILAEKTNGTNFLVLGSHIQPFPPPTCLVPLQLTPPLNTLVRFVSRTANSITLLLPEIRSKDACENISMASVKFTVYYKIYKYPDIQKCNETCNKIITFDSSLNISGLKPFTNYSFSVEVENYFSAVKGVPANIGPATVFQTAAGAPTKPLNISAVVLNPTTVEVKWLPPYELNGESVFYQIHWQTKGTINGVRKRDDQDIFKDKDSLNSLNKIPKYRQTRLQILSPNQTYLLWIRALSENRETFNDSNVIQIHTYPEPNEIILLNSTATSLIISWEPSPEIKYYLFQYADIEYNRWKNISNKQIKNGTIYISNLIPKMKYRFRLSLTYLDFSEPHIWPSDSRFMFETLGDKPSPPGVPRIVHVKADVYRISWEASRENGAPILMYNLEGKSFYNYRTKRNTNRTAWFNNSPSVEEKENEWTSYYNGTDNYWITSGLSDKFRYSFRVLAKNENGWSEPSAESVVSDISTAAMRAERHEQLGVILGISIPLLVVICVCIIICFVYLVRRKDQDKKTTQTMLISQSINPDVELATLRELPRRDNFIHNTNALYVSSLPSVEELALLPQIKRDQITLINFLGRGAFGEVYEGKARVGENGAEMKVAVKTLRKGATEQEKIEFLQEAQLMSHFKHEHILQLLGVCLDTHFIIMELMQGGDLLTYLRSNRKPMSTSDSLTIMDLLSMCVDVARGCRYLEEMHFVHRDLACRNCLVSSKDRQSRVVKIGDFGLARDIYKNDYYRKEGEGLLPVRWMAPESLVDGVFTCQSDVWAFGVLMWEIMTLGQQPYPARNNLEVLHYVKGGGRLEKPAYCPDDLHKLMMLCWSYQPENRPTFKHSLEVLEELRNSIADKALTAAHSGNYISSVQNGCSWKSEEISNKDQVPLVRPSKQELNLPLQQSTEAPKYLEIICDSSYVTRFNDGYEIPRSSINSKKSLKNIKDLPVRSRTFSTSSTLSNDSVVSTTKLNCDLNVVNNVCNTLVQNL